MGGCAQALLVGPVRGGAPDAPVADDTQEDGLVLDQRRLVHLRAREACEAGALAVGEGLGFVGGAEPPSLLG